MANEVKITITAKDNASKTTQAIGRELKNLGGAAEDAGGGIQGFADNWSGLLIGINQGIQIAQQAWQALEKVYEVAREGAALEYAEIKFNNLAESIGTTADVLLTDLRQATGGIMSDAELMQSATDMMGLGLAKTADEAIRLATVAGALGMNMNQLTLTLTNKTTMRFDTLGVSVDGFKEKVKELEEAGLDADAAFTEAFLQQAEAQIERVGSVADTTYGSFMQLEAAAGNLANVLKTDLAEALGPVVKWLAEGVTELANYKGALQKAEAAGVDTSEVTWKVANGIWTTGEAVEYLDNVFPFLTADMGYYADIAERSAEASEELGDGLEYVYDATANIENKLGALAAQRENETDYYKNILSLTGKYTDSLEDIADLQGRLADLQAIEGGGYLDGVYMRASEVADAIADITDEIQSVEDAMGDMADQVVLDMAMAEIAAGGITSAEFEMYMALGVELGKFSEEAANKAITEFDRAVGYWNALQFPDKTVDIFAKYHDPYGVLSGLGGLGGPGYSLPSTNVAIGGTIQSMLTPAAGGYWVGEVGPEPFFPAQDGRILSHSDAMTAMRGSGGRGGSNITVHIHTPINLADEAFVQQELAPYIIEAIRRERIIG
jgi:hypothetical protein